MRSEQIYNSWSKIKPDAAAHERMLANILERSRAKKRLWKVLALAPVAACLIILLAVFIPRLGVEAPPPADFPPPYAVIPPPVEEELTIDQARECPNFGAFLPISTPFTLDRVWMSVHDDVERLFAFYGSSMDNLIWQVSHATEHDLSLVVDVNDREKFDLSLYTIPWFQSVPDELIQYVMNPVFPARDITLDVVEARAMEARGGGVQMNFGVLFGDIVVTISSSGLSPLEVYEIIQEVFQ